MHICGRETKINHCSVLLCSKLFSIFPQNQFVVFDVRCTLFSNKCKSVYLYLYPLFLLKRILLLLVSTIIIIMMVSVVFSCIIIYEKKKNLFWKQNVAIKVRSPIWDYMNLSWV